MAADFLSDGRARDDNALGGHLHVQRTMLRRKACVRQLHFSFHVAGAHTHQRFPRRHGPQQAPVQALPDIVVRIPQAIYGLAVQVVLAADRQVTGLEQQGFGGHLLDVEGGQQVFPGRPVLERAP